MLIIWQRETHTDKEMWREGKLKKRKGKKKAGLSYESQSLHQNLRSRRPRLRSTELSAEWKWIWIGCHPLFEMWISTFYVTCRDICGVFLWWQLYKSYQSEVADWNAISICRDGKNEPVKQPLVPVIASVDIAFHCCTTLSLFNPSYIRLWTESFFGLTVF